MKEQHSIIEFPKSRLATADLGKLSRNKHSIHALLEIDVTDAKKIISERKTNTNDISFTSWMIFCISAALKKHPEACGYVSGRNKKIIFNSISISMIVEKSIEGKKVPVPVLIENADEKTPEDIFRIISSGKKSEASAEKDYAVNSSISGLMMKIYFSLPQFLRLFSMKLILNNPFKSKKMMGNALFTSLGNTALMPGWIIPRTYHNLAFALGSVSRKPWVVNEKILPRDIAHLTVIADHDVTDGVPLARFTSELVRRLENAEGL